MESTTPIASIARIQNLFDTWRQLGSRKLPNGTELIARSNDDGEEHWLHVIYPGLSVNELTAFEHRLRMKLPRDLRAFYRRTAGMSLWGGAFTVYGHRAHDHPKHGDARPADALRLNHELEVIGWKPANAFAFAENAWDMSVHVVGMAHNPAIAQRRDRISGLVLEEHPNVWSCIAARLYRIDQLMMPQPNYSEYSIHQTSTPVTDT